MDEELNYTEFPTEEPVTVQFDIPSFRHQQSTSSPIFKDHDSVSTFHSKHSDISEFQADDEEMIDVEETTKESNKVPPSKPKESQSSTSVNDNQTMITQSTLPSSLASIQASHSELEVSGITEDSSRISLLEQQFKTITSNFTVMMEKLSKQTASNTENQQELYLLLKHVLQKENDPGDQVITPQSPPREEVRNSSTASRQSSTSPPQANYLSMSDEAGGSIGAAGHSS
jgi:hypothetical protein